MVLVSGGSSEWKEEVFLKKGADQGGSKVQPASSTSRNGYEAIKRVRLGKVFGKTHSFPPVTSHWSS